MLPSRHFLFGFIFAGFIYLIFPKITWIGFSLIFLSTILIDVDHYLYYMYKKKDLNLKNAYGWHIKKFKKFLSLNREQRNNFKSNFYIFHGVEILFIIVFLWVFISIYFFFIFVGFAFHLLLDSIDQPVYWDKVSKVSLVRDFLRFR